MSNGTNYLFQLFEEYKQTLGINEQSNMNQHIANFRTWLLYKDEHLTNYVYLLKQIGLLRLEGTIVELHKSDFDTVVKLLKVPTKVIAVTPFESTFKNCEVKVYKGKLDFFNKQAKLYYDPSNRPEDNINITTYITQLPADDTSLITAMISSIFEGKNIVIGTYGDINDIDRNVKISILKGIYKKLKILGEALSTIKTEEYLETFNGTYTHIIKTNKK